MATIGANVLTLTDWAKRLDPDGKIAAIAELLAETNEMLQDMPWFESNSATGHRLTVRTGLPTPTWRMLNQGIAPTKSTTAQIDEELAMLEDWVEVDKDLAELNGNTPEFRLSEALGHLEGMNQEMASTLFYGSAVDPEEFVGLANRFNDLSAGNAQNILDAGGVGADNSSIWLIVWSSESLFGIFPKGSQVGLMHEDLGLVTVETTAGIAGNRMRAYQDHWQWKAGLALKDWRYVVRIANIDISDLAGGSPADLIDLMIRALHRPPSLRIGKACFYMNRTVMQWLDIQRRNDVAGAGMTYVDVDGRMIPHFRGVPLRLSDALTETEAQVT